MVDENRQLTCAGCGCALLLDAAAGVIRTLQGLGLRLTYLDSALAVWDCPGCGFADAADLAG